MCGIGGYQVLQGGEKPSVETVLTLLTNLGNRGKDAAGLGWLDEDDQGKKVRYLKFPMEPKKLAEELRPRVGKVWPEGLPDALLLHSRAGTGGTPKNPRNNHPVIAFRPVCVAVTHNGVLHDTDNTFKQLGFRPKCEVDTEALALALSVGLDRKKEWRSALDQVHKCSGSAAFAAISPHVDGVVVAKGSEGSALVFGFDEPKRILWWASEEWMLPIHSDLPEFGGGWTSAGPTLVPKAGEALVLRPAGVEKLKFTKLAGCTTSCSRGRGNWGSYNYKTDDCKEPEPLGDAKYSAGSTAVWDRYMDIVDDIYFGRPLVRSLVHTR